MEEDEDNYSTSNINYNLDSTIKNLYIYNHKFYDLTKYTTTTKIKHENENSSSNNNNSNSNSNSNNNEVEEFSLEQYSAKSIRHLKFLTKNESMGQTFSA